MIWRQRSMKRNKMDKLIAVILMLAMMLLLGMTVAYAGTPEDEQDGQSADTPFVITD